MHNHIAVPLQRVVGLNKLRAHDAVRELGAHVPQSAEYRPVFRIQHLQQLVHGDRSSASAVELNIPASHTHTQ